MARVVAHKKTAGQKKQKVVRPPKEKKPKKVSRTSRHESAKVKTRPAKAGRGKVAAAKRKAPSASHHPLHKDSKTMQAERGKSALKTGTSSPPAAAPRLLQQTKTTSAALALLQKGIELIFQKEFKKARIELKTLLETYPGELDILARARSYIQICEREEAVQKRQEISTDQLYALGVLEHNRANYDTAISYFLQSLEKHPNADYIYYSIAASHALKGNPDESLENLRKAVELNEDSRVYAKNDGDFASLQTRKEFAELVGIALLPETEQQ